MLSDRAYSSAANRAYLRKRWIKAVISVEDQKANRRNRGRAGGRPPAFDAGRYTERNTVERCFGKLKQFRAVATRYDKREITHQEPSIWHRSGSGYKIPPGQGGPGAGQPPGRASGPGRDARAGSAG